MKKSILLLLLVLLSVELFSQAKITGKIVDTGSKPIEYAEVTLLSKDSVLLKGTLTDANGIFTLDYHDGSYTLQIRQLGKLLLTKTVSLQSNLDLGTIQVDNTLAINEVVVGYRRKVVERKLDRVVLNVERSIAASGGDGMDALKLAPGVRVQNNQIALVGRSSVRVMVNEKMIELSGDELVDFIKNLRADQIAKVEVITSPPARYEAEGNSGLINIVTKRAKLNSLSGNVRASLSQAERGVGSGGANISYQKDKLTLTTNIGYSAGCNQPYQEYALDYPSYYWREVNRKSYYVNSLSGRFTSEYKLNPSLTLGCEYSLSDNTPRVKSENRSSVYSRTFSLDSIISNRSTMDVSRITNAVSIYSLVKFDTSGRKANIYGDYLGYSSNTNNSYASNTFFADGSVKPDRYHSANNLSDLGIDVFAVGADVEFPTKWVNLSFGTKLSFVNNRSNVKLFNTTGQAPVLDAGNADRFLYSENIQALYLTATKSLLKNLNMQAGIRTEWVQTKGESKSTSRTDRNSYYKLFPNLLFTYSPDQDHTLSLTYNRRVTRPSYNNLNPFRFYSTPYNYSQGNPFLEPYYTSNGELSYSYRNLYTSLYISYIENKFDEVTYVQSGSIVQVVEPRNFYNQVSYGLFQGWVFSVGSWWEGSLDVSTFYSKSSSRIEDIVPGVSRWSGSCSTNSTFVFDKAKRYMGEMGFLYQLPSLAGSYKLSSYYQLDLGFKYTMNSHLQLSVGIADILKTSDKTFIQVVNGIKQVNYDYADTRRVNISLTYSFGKKLKVETYDSSKNSGEERGRMVR